MNKNLAKKVTLSILAGAVLMSSSVVWAENITVGGKVLWYDDGYLYIRNKSDNDDGIIPVDTYTKPFYGVYEVNGPVNGGKVTVNGGTFNSYIYGGYSNEGDATTNTVFIKSGDIYQVIYGGYSYKGNAGGNTVEISGESTINASIYGGYSGASGEKDYEVKNNKVNITGGKFSDNIYIYGGAFYGLSGNVSGNKVGISGGELSNTSIYGGYHVGSSGNVNGNEVTISGESTIDGFVCGSYSGLGNANGNTVTISGSEFSGDIYGGMGYSGATQNTVTISGESTIDGSVYGGNSYSGNAIGNTVNISKGTISSEVYGGYSYSGNADGNSVIIKAGNVSGTVYGGYSYYGSAINNKVIISGGNLSGNTVYGGYVVGGEESTTGEAKNNTVTISGDADLTGAWLCAGYAKDADNITGNILNIGINEALLEELDPADEDGKRKYGLQVGSWNKNKVGSIRDFDVINFANINWDTTTPAVEVTGKLIVNNTKVTVGEVHVASGDTTFAGNKKMTLIRASGIEKENPNYQPGSSEPAYIDATIENDSLEATKIDGTSTNIFYGVAEVYKASIKQEANNGKQDINLVLGDVDTKVDNPNSNTGGSVSGGSTPGGGESGGGTTGGESDGETPQPVRNDQVLVLGESRAAAVAFTNQGSELIETGLNALARDNEKDTKVFAAVYGNHSEYETGSHVNVNGWSGIVGIGKTNADGLTVGAFFENGEGNYSTHNIFTNDYIRGDGEACYNGGGFLVRKDNANGVYTEASLRAGNLQNELRNAVRNGSELTGYDIDTFYYGAHVGIGKVIARGNDGDSIDVYGKFIYTHHDGETFDIGGTATKFDSVESERLRLGFRINEVQTNKLSMYYGAAWEYEFNGDAHDKIASFDLETPSLEGSTVIGEIGAHYKASDKWSIDLNGRAYVGQREGFSGSVQANYAF